MFENIPIFWIDKVDTMSFSYNLKKCQKIKNFEFSKMSPSLNYQWTLYKSTYLLKSIFFIFIFLKKDEE